MKATLVGILAVVATAPAYIVGRLFAFLFYGTRGGNFLAELFWEFIAGAAAALGAYFVISVFLKKDPQEANTHLVVVAIVMTILISMSMLGLATGYEYHGSAWQAAGGLIGLPIGFIVASVLLRRQ